MRFEYILYKTDSVLAWKKLVFTVYATELLSGDGFSSKLHVLMWFL